MSVNYQIIEATNDHINDILDVTNDAFMVDAFFKKPEHFLRFKFEVVQEMMSKPNAWFLVAVRDSDGVVLGSLHLEIDIVSHPSGTGKQVVGHFGAVSVPPKNERQGIGKRLVQAAEEKVISIAREIAANGEPVEAKMEMGVVNLRSPLFPWYESQNYVILGDIKPNDPGFDVLISDEYKEKVWLILMRKPLPF